MARAHLEAGHDVIVPQLLTRRAFVDELQATTEASGATFFEFALIDARETCSSDSSSAASQATRSAPEL